MIYFYKELAAAVQQFFSCYSESLLDSSAHMPVHEMRCSYAQKHYTGHRWTSDCKSGKRFHPFFGLPRCCSTIVKRRIAWPS